MHCLMMGLPMLMCAWMNTAPALSPASVMFSLCKCVIFH